jgi:hypothetical protein
MKRKRSGDGRARPTTGRVGLATEAGTWPLNPGPSYLLANERFYLAVRTLAAGAGEIKQRLAAAFIHISLLREGDVPAELQPDLQWIRGRLLKNEPKLLRGVEGGKVRQFSSGRLGATVPYMRIASAVQVAERICYVESRLGQLCSVVEKGSNE